MSQWTVVERPFPFVICIDCLMETRLLCRKDGEGPIFTVCECGCVAQVGVGPLFHRSTWIEPLPPIEPPVQG